MALTNGILTRPIETAEIAECIGVASRDVGTLCTSDNIKMWAKYKPVDVDSMGVLTEDERAAASYGIVENTEYSIVDSSSWSEAFTNAENGIYSWSYKKPTTKYRMLDFDGYNHNAVCPLFFEAAGEGYVRIGLETESSLPDYNLKLSDLITLPSMANLSDSYFGILYKKNGGSTVYMIFDDENGNGLYPCYDADTGEAMSYSIELGEGEFEVIGIVGAPNRGYFAVLPFAPVSFEYTAPVIRQPTIDGVWGPNESGNKIRVDWGIDVGDYALKAGSVMVGFFAGDVPTKISEWEGQALFTWYFDYPALAVGERYSLKDEIIELDPDEVANVAFYANVKNNILQGRFAYTENFD